MILIAVIGKAQGLSGQMRLKTFTDKAEALAHYNCFYDKDGKKYSVADLTVRKGIPVIALQGINSRDLAEKMAGVELFVKRKQFTDDLDDDEFYQEDLLDFTVFNERKEPVGRVSGFFNFGGGDLLEVSLSSSATVPNAVGSGAAKQGIMRSLGRSKAGKERKELIPFTRVAVPQIMLAEKYIIIDSLAAGLVSSEEEDEIGAL